MYWIAPIPSVAAAADVWATVEAVDDRGVVRLQVPARALVVLGEWPLAPPRSAPVDLGPLAREVAAAASGSTREVEVTGVPGQAATLVLWSAEPAGPAPRELEMTFFGPGAARRLLALPLTRATLRRALEGVDLAALGLALADRESLAIVRRHPPTVLVEVHAPLDAAGVRIETR